MNNEQALYTTIGTIQELIANHYRTYHTKISFFDALNTLIYSKKLFHDFSKIHIPRFEELLPDEAFESLISKLPIHVSLIESTKYTAQVRFGDIIPHTKDILAYKHIPFAKRVFHVHTHIEINYVYSGTATLEFENEQRVLQTGELCILAPQAKHDLLVDYNSLCICIVLRKNTFDTLFGSFMTQSDLLSVFFRNTLYEDTQANYLIFKTDNTPYIKRILQGLIIESNSEDAYTNTCSINYVHLLFSYVLRRYSDTIEFQNYEKQRESDLDFALLLQYIQHNYKTVTLKSLSEFFHYSEVHLSKLIKQNIKRNFTDIIRDLKMKNAISYLVNTDLKIGQIFELVGYENIEHFSRTFKTLYKISPREYRRLHQSKDSDTTETAP